MKTFVHRLGIGLISWSLIAQISCTSSTSDKSVEESPVAKDSLKPGDYKAFKTTDSMLIDGLGTEKIWDKAAWAPISYRWLGDSLSESDFKGRFKMLWDKQQLYYLVEIQDDSLSDQRKSPFDNWWEDDCLELFIDENKSGGNHQFNHNAFAYHITLDGDVVDLGPDKNPHLYNHHLKVKWTRKGNLFTWEVALNVYNDTYKDGDTTQVPVSLESDKRLGFAVSFNDNDGNRKREHFHGSMEIPGEDKNRGWIDAGLFGTLKLEE